MSTKSSIVYKENEGDVLHVYEELSYPRGIYFELRTDSAYLCSLITADVDEKTKSKIKNLFEEPES